MRITGAIAAAWLFFFSTACFGADPVRFAVIGDYGTNDDPSVEVAKMVKGWKPDFILTVGDNSYIDAEKGNSGFERAVTDHFDGYIKSREDDPAAEKTQFFPTLGNHDYESDGGGVDEARLDEYEKAFALPAGEGGFRYYQFARGPVRFFALDSNTTSAAAGAGTASKQYRWWKKAMGEATERWKIAYFHHAPYHSGVRHRNDTHMRAWNFERSGISAVISGHLHVYERLSYNGVPFFVNGFGGRHLHAFLRRAVAGSQVRYPQGRVETPEEKRFGAMLVQATDTTITFEAWNLDRKLIDRWPTGAPAIEVPPDPPPPTP